MERVGGPADAGAWRVVSLAALGVVALTALARAFTSGSLPIAALGAGLFGAFAVLLRASFARPRPVVPGEGQQPPADETTEERSHASGATSAMLLQPPADPAARAPACSEVEELLADPAPAPPRVNLPPTLDPHHVCMALLESCAAAGDVVSVSLWLEDPSSQTLRHVAAVGSFVPESRPLAIHDDPIGLAVTEGRARLCEIETAATTPYARVWRFAVPVTADRAYGSAAIDFAGTEPPDSALLIEVTAQLRPSLAGALALHLAKNETDAAHALVDTARELTRRLDPASVVEHALSRAMALSGAVTGSVMLLDPETRLLRIAAAQGLDPQVVRDTRVREGEGIAGWVLATGKPVLVEDLPGRREGRRGDVRSAMCVPLADEDGILGVLNVGSKRFPARFTDTHMDALTLLGTQTAAALRNARAMSSARQLYFATLRALALALETKDPYARGTTDRVVTLATALGKELRLDEAGQQALEIAALLHDIGMSASGEAIAATSRPLSTFERGLLKLHPVLAAEILEEVPALQSVIPMVYHHHEWYDGRGYVVGLAGEAIPLGARILAVADAYTAMTTDRPYRAAMSQREARDELVRGSGTQFDPEVVHAFLDLLEREPWLAGRNER